MPKRIAYSTLNASSVDIMNVIRQNANYEYQSQVPLVDVSTDIPKVGEVIYGNPALANTFINALLTRIAKTAIMAATFNNPFARLKKGYIEWGENIQEIFLDLIDVIDYNQEKANGRENRRYIPDVQSVFHTINWRVMYPLSISENELKTAFLSENGLNELVNRLINQIYTSAEYDEFLLFKYLMIKAYSHNKIKPVFVDTTNGLTEAAVAFRSVSNRITMMSKEYNSAGVRTNTPKSRQVIFMDSDFNARFDVTVLASAFNMDKADFMGALYLIDDFNSFDNERFQEIRKVSTMIEDVTTEELLFMENVKAMLFDEDWFQVYDNENRMKEHEVASGLYWNYFYHVWKTVSFSPFANAIGFTDKEAQTNVAQEITVEIIGKDTTEEATVLTLEASVDGTSATPYSFRFVQTEALTQAGIAVQPYGAIIIPADKTATEILVEILSEPYNTVYTTTTTINAASAVGTTIKLT